MKLKKALAATFLTVAVMSHVPAEAKGKEACVVFAEQAQILAEMRDRGIPSTDTDKVLMALKREKATSPAAHTLYMLMSDFVYIRKQMSPQAVYDFYMTETKCK